VLIEASPPLRRRRRRQRQWDAGNEIPVADSLSVLVDLVPDLSAFSHSFRKFVDAANTVSPRFAATGNREQIAEHFNQLSTAAWSLLDELDNLRISRVRPIMNRNETQHALSQAVQSHVLRHSDLIEAIAFECCTWWLQLVMDAWTRKGNERIASYLQQDAQSFSKWNSGLARLALILSDSTTTRSVLSDYTKHNCFETCSFSLTVHGITPHAGATRDEATGSLADAEIGAEAEVQASDETFPIASLVSSLKRERGSVILTTGPPGCGKSYGCSQFLRVVKEIGEIENGSTTIRPDMPMDMLAGTIKRSGCRPFTLSSYSERRMYKIGSTTVLLFDSFDSAVLDATAGSSARLTLESSTFRTRISLLSIIDVIRKRVEDQSRCGDGSGGNLLLLLTASDSHSLNTTRFDQVIELSLPNDRERRQILVDWFLQGPDTDTNTTTRHRQSREEFLDEIVDCTRGRSRSEMLYYCREGAFALSTGKDTLPDEQSRLQRLRGLFQATNAASAKNRLGGDDEINVQVTGPAELAKLLSAYSTGNLSNIRKGWENRSAWDQLHAAILTPLCHSHELCDLLYSSRSGEQKVKRDAFAGALITGDSGSGKSLIARYCAALASSRLPAICLIEINCVSLIHKELGESERSVRQTFDLARAAAPCVLVLDGVEHIAPVRGKDNTTQGTMDRVLSTMLTEMDGIGGDASAMSKRVAVIGITTDVTWIDQALCRPGRLERCVRM